MTSEVSFDFKNLYFFIFALTVVGALGLFFYHLKNMKSQITDLKEKVIILENDNIRYNNQVIPDPPLNLNNESDKINPEMTLSQSEDIRTKLDNDDIKMMIEQDDNSLEDPEISKVYNNDNFITDALDDNKDDNKEDNEDDNEEDNEDDSLDDENDLEDDSLEDEEDEEDEDEEDEEDDDDSLDNNPIDDNLVDNTLIDGNLVDNNLVDGNLELTTENETIELSEIDKLMQSSDEDENLSENLNSTDFNLDVDLDGLSSEINDIDLGMDNMIETPDFSSHSNDNPLLTLSVKELQDKIKEINDKKELKLSISGNKIKLTERIMDNQ
jgi:hypothetical protein